APAPAAFRVMEVVSVGVDLPEQFPVLVLGEAEGARRQLSFRVGLPEGAALARAVGQTMAARPMSGDLLAAVLERFAIDVVAVRLVGRYGATYLAELDLMGSRGREVVPCRPTDGITAALLQKVPAPVLADERLLSSTGDVPGPAA
ncbi:MAG: bifunctional nuclease family protein, partial [Acidimicrobiales bacterium]